MGNELRFFPLLWGCHGNGAQGDAAPMGASAARTTMEGFSGSTVLLKNIIEGSSLN